MSLFGTSPEEDPAARSKRGNALFSDGNTEARKPSPDLFADDINGGDDSPWGGMPTPKKGGTREAIKTLLATDDVPETYIDTFDALVASGDGIGGGVSVKGAKKVLENSSLNDVPVEKISKLVLLDRSDEAALTRGEFNVLLALVGLAQENEELTLDGVDERKRGRNLPRPTLKHDFAPQPTNDIPETPPASSGQAQATPSPDQSRTMRKQSFGFPETDPWASPVQNKNLDPSATATAAHTNGMTNGSSMPGRTTSTFTTTSEQADSTSGGGTGGNSGWGGDNNFGGDGGFGAPAGAPGGSGDDPAGLRRTLGGGATAGTTGPEEVIIVQALPEKEGTFLFQHHNYQLLSARRASKVVRRYSDFVWLLDCLHKRYPFRQLPLLPPKRVAINGNYLAADNSFLEKRRRGLARFANTLVRHPVLGQEQLVVMFLTVPTELAVWRRQASISVQEEFVGKELPPSLEDSLPPNLGELFDTVRSGVRRSAEVYINLCNLTERIAKRNEGMASDLGRFSRLLTTATEASKDTYAVDTNDVPLLNEGLISVSKHFAASQSLMEDESRSWEVNTLEDLKRQRDCLVSVRDLFDRRDRFAKDNIPQLERRIQANETKLSGIRARSEAQQRPGEAEKLEEAIFRDKQSIVQQHARGVFIKECIRDELQFFQQSQYHVSRLHQDWSQERVKYVELQADNWRTLSEQVESMPLGGS